MHSVVTEAQLFFVATLPLCLLGNFGFVWSIVLALVCTIHALCFSHCAHIMLLYYGSFGLD